MKTIDKILRKIRRNKCRKKLKALGRNASIAKGVKIIGGGYINVGNNFNADENLLLQAWDNLRIDDKAGKQEPKLQIGDNVSLQRNCQISCCDEIIIGDGCLFGDNVFLTDNFHGNTTYEELQKPPLERALFVKGGIVIEKNVWIGRNVCIMPGVIIGESSIIGANAVVTKSIPPFSIVAGVPAKIIRRAEIV